MEERSCTSAATANTSWTGPQKTSNKVYAPTEEADDAEKDEFQDVLQTVNEEVLRRGLKTVICNINAQFSREKQGFEDTSGPFTSSKWLLGSAEWLMLFCMHNKYLLQEKSIHKKMIIQAV